jgi:hypothetical protein
MKDWLNTLCAIKGNKNLLVHYVALVSGLRKSIDDWIPWFSVPDFTRHCKTKGLYVGIDCVFLFNAFQSTDFLKMPTTNANAARYDPNKAYPQNAKVHLIITTDKDAVEDILACCWYPVSVNNEIVAKPRIDHRRLGHHFSYPSCCVDFFLRQNDWTRRSVYYDAYKKSDAIDWRCNCLLKHTTSALIFHIPCSFDCPRTISYSNQLLAAVGAVDIHLRQKIESNSRQTFLVLDEINTFFLADSKSLTSSEVKFSHGISTRTENSLLSRKIRRFLKQSDRLVVDGLSTMFFKGKQLTGQVDLSYDKYGVKIPILLTFEDTGSNV